MSNLLMTAIFIFIELQIFISVYKYVTKLPDLKEKSSPKHCQWKIKNLHFKNYIDFSFLYYTKISVSFFNFFILRMRILTVWFFCFKLLLINVLDAFQHDIDLSF